MEEVPAYSWSFLDSVGLVDGLLALALVPQAFHTMPAALLAFLTGGAILS